MAAPGAFVGSLSRRAVGLAADRYGAQVMERDEELVGPGPACWQVQMVASGASGEASRHGEEATPDGLVTTSPGIASPRRAVQRIRLCATSSLGSTSGERRRGRPPNQQRPRRRTRTTCRPPHHRAGRGPSHVGRHSADTRIPTQSERPFTAGAGVTEWLAPLPTVTSTARSTTRRSTTTRPKPTSTKPPGKKIWVVYGRNAKARTALFRFLRSLELSPVEFGSAIKSGSPYIGEILEEGFKSVHAVVVLLTGDDEARLRALYRKKTDPEYEAKLTPQPRPNVLFEAGMAFGRFPRSTVVVQIGKVRPFSDVLGRHVIQLDNSPETRTEFANRLVSIGCAASMSGTDWLSEGDFAS